MSFYLYRFRFGYACILSILVFYVSFNLRIVPDLRRRTVLVNEVQHYHSPLEQPLVKKINDQEARIKGQFLQTIIKILVKKSLLIDNFEMPSLDQEENIRIHVRGSFDQCWDFLFSLMHSKFIQLTDFVFSQDQSSYQLQLRLNSQPRSKKPHFSRELALKVNHFFCVPKRITMARMK